MKKYLLFCVGLIVSLMPTSCASQSSRSGQTETDTIAMVLEPVSFPSQVSEIVEPEGYERVQIDDTTSFAYYLRHLPLKPKGTPVRYYNGEISGLNELAYAVIDGFDTGTEDIQQCADAIIRLRAEWLYKHQRYDDIAFHFTNGWLCDYKHWAEGYRVAVKGNHTSWYQAKSRDYSYKTFRKYLDMVFNYAGTLSLSKELKPVKLQDMQIGDVFIIGGSPGHAILVIDVAENPKTGDKSFVVAESYMPAQDIHILINERHASISPWYSLKDFMDEGACNFPTYWYSTDCLKRF